MGVSMDLYCLSYARTDERPNLTRERAGNVMIYREKCLRVVSLSPLYPIGVMDAEAISKRGVGLHAH